MEARYKEEEIVKYHGGYLVRLLNCLEEFCGKHGRWPAKLHLSIGANRVLKDDHLTPLGYSLLSQKLHLVVSHEEDGPLVAEGSEGENLDYGSEGWSGTPDLPKAGEWLWGVSVY